MARFNICVGSLNPTKVNSVKNAFSLYFENFKIHKIKAASGVPDQPIGINQIIRGAKNRAQVALEYLINRKRIKHGIYGVGIEAGLVKIPIARSNYMDFQFCIIMDENEELTIGSGIGFEYPPSIINEILSNPQVEIGDLMGRLAENENLKNEAGAISYLSKNVIVRTEILTQAVTCALLPIVNKHLYES
ncbi:MAG: inosine/xanthosine triphosphatase [Promethearchaeota archaeon]|nr:MAG: inosine/xanthosine triphosphatase [Candidatus Lokiarchaeota archaeon]